MTPRRAETDHERILLRGAGKATKEFPMRKAILTDSHFWIPVLVQLLGIALLVYLR